MTYLEMARTIGYALFAPSLLYFAFIHWNKGERSAAVALGGLSLFFSILMAGLVLVSYFEPVPELLILNTGVIVFVPLVTIYTVFEYRKRKVDANLSVLDEILREQKTRQGRLSGH